MIIFVHRKDLRVDDMLAFHYIHSQRKQSLHVLILDPFLLKHERHLEHSGINFLQHTARLQQLYLEAGQQLHILYGEPSQVLAALLAAHPVEELVFHEDCTPYAKQRDRLLRAAAKAAQVNVTSFDEQALLDLRDFHQWSGRSEPYKVFTPFYRKWSDYRLRFYRPAAGVHVSQLATVAIAPATAEAYALPRQLAEALSAAGGTCSAALPQATAGLGEAAASPDPHSVLRSFLAERLSGYADGRDRFALEATSRLSRHLNVGAISARTVYEALLESEQREVWLRQLAWRDFYIYQARLDADYFHYEKRYDLSPLDNRHFQAWCEARTGIPIIDAAMTELHKTGWMPNRLRMVTAMFLTKNLLCPFTYGEQYFRYKLSDYDNVLNRGGWLWCASLGFDAAPYFRIMNPVTQSLTHDPSAGYIRRWLPELAGLSDKQIHQPRSHALVDLTASRARAIEVYKGILQSGRS
ncbi:deoxyribodipyrimidine photo-lyase [Paenibacillus sp. 1_12]|uniref:cryptochrome/photolyase family protein n=1 Tax=Paenibacillus sp. 1_12 TaxID=1566278 RepID=UPI0008EEE8B0|nr:deoxyribodipyrimidine photo-lyase [Paenibacillus sp. 1_12]SFL93304.1 deoxyribodipyrimidine photo-lyase [Paenibacillus sp. 1_12]